MHFINFALAAVALLSSSAQAAPTDRPITALNEEMLLTIAPLSKSCAGAQFPAECRTAAQAIKPITDSFVKYKIENPFVQAALVSLMAYETGEFKYNVKHYPSLVPGAGTRNMQSPKYNELYAKSLGTTVDQLFTREGASFGSAAWFITANCPASMRQNMWTGSTLGWVTYIKDCVGTTADEKRVAYWSRARQALRPHKS